MNKEERLKLESREKEIDRQKEALERQRLEVQDSWNNYQKECEASQKTDPLAVFSVFTCIGSPFQTTQICPTMIAENR